MRGVVAEAETPLERFTSRPGGDGFFVPGERGTKEPLLTDVERAVRHRLRCGCRHGGVPRDESGAGEHDALARQSRRHGVGAHRGWVPEKLRVRAVRVAGRWQSLDDLPGGSGHDPTAVLTWRPLHGLAFSDS